MSNKRKGREDSEAGIRTFVCIEIPEAIQQRIGELQTQLRSVEAKVSWVKPSNIHLTLKFLGSISPLQLAAVCEAVERITSSRRPFEVEVIGTGCFPSSRNPRVLWAGITASSELNDLHGAVDSELARFGFQRETRKFSPHLTIGRLRSPSGSHSLSDAVANSSLRSIKFNATQVVVMRSDLHPSGSLYTAQAILPLARADHQSSTTR